MNKVLLIAASCAMFAVAASADPAAAPANTTTPDPDKMVCRTTAPVVGTRLGARRECATQREWDQRRMDAQKALQDTQTHTFMQSGGG